MEVKIANLPTGDPIRLIHYRVDETHSNAHTLWLAMGSPTAPSSAQYEQLVEAGQLAELQPQQKVKVDDGLASLKLQLPRQAVSLLILEWGEPHQ